MHWCALAWDQVTPWRGKGSPHIGDRAPVWALSLATTGYSFTCQWALDSSHPSCAMSDAPTSRVSTDLLSVLRIYPEVGLLGHRVVLILVFEEPPHCFPERLHHFVSHTRGFQFPSVWYHTTLLVCFCLFVLIVTILVTVAWWLLTEVLIAFFLMIHDVGEFSCVYLAICILFGDLYILLSSLPSLKSDCFRWYSCGTLHIFGASTPWRLQPAALPFPSVGHLPTVSAVSLRVWALCR